MKEASFIRSNIEKWRKTEAMVSDPLLSTPDELAEAYTELTADLAFAQTHWRRIPNSPPTSRLPRHTTAGRGLRFT